MKRFLIVIFSFVTITCAFAAPKPFFLTENTTVCISNISDEKPVVLSALQMFAHDVKNVLNGTVSYETTNQNIIVGTLKESFRKHCDKTDIEFLKEHNEGFVIKVLPSGKLLVVGADSHGTAYGLLELSRLMGVSPWEWWADALPDRKDSFGLPAGFVSRQAPSVEYRGIFINDEDWGLMPWSSMTMEPENKRGVVGPKTTERIFELLLRLRANTYWPPMHECSEPFFLTPGNREVAEKYGIYIGGSHCEPMASSTAVEWGRRGVGEYDYVNNSNNVFRFWENRVKDVANQEIIYTLGMRGVHDGAMNGAKTVEEQKTVLTKVFADQRKLLARYVNSDVTAVPQVFIPYKEVLDVYNAGLEVPEDITLMWCDDNYGYIRHFPTPQERTRKGGNGIYYHISYWGRPHDYLWLGTFSPYLLYQQMSEAYNRGIQKMWILNVGDIKPAEYQIELFMDMAWDIDAVVTTGVSTHMKSFFKREFGDRTVTELTQVMNEYYRLAFIRKPEFLGNTRCEEYGPGAEKWYEISDLPWSDRYITDRLAEYSLLSDKVEKLNNEISENRLDTYFQLVKYPVQAAAEMNKKMLYAQLARHGKALWDKCDMAYDSIQSLTRNYNQGIYNHGKWNGIMDCKPREQPVFSPVRHTASGLIADMDDESYILNGADYKIGNPIIHVGLGYEGRSVGIKKGHELVYDIGKHCASDSVDIILKFLPSHPILQEDGLRLAVIMDNNEPVYLDYSTVGRSEEWKENVLRNHAIRRMRFNLSNQQCHKLRIKAMADGIILDQIEIKNKR